MSLKTQPLVPIGSGIWELLDAYGSPRISEALRRFGTKSHDAKLRAEVLRPLDFDAEEGVFSAERPPTKLEKGRSTRSFNAAARILHIRLEYLLQLEKHPQAKARKVVRDMFGIKAPTLRGYLRPAKNPKS